MNAQKAKKFTNKIFSLIMLAKSIEELEAIPRSSEIPVKNLMNDKGYPKLEFEIKKGEIESLVKAHILDNNYDFTNDVTTKLKDPLVKLLYATAWKNGDLIKVKHIIKGVMDAEKEDIERNEALVFYQFGKYLTKTPGQPIIDQHVIRAFVMFKFPDNIKPINNINKEHKEFINKYKEWLISDELTNELRNCKDYTYHIDKLLFATGKTIKKLS
jgi:hypothetical protein